MKKLMIVMLSLGLAVGASAQRGHGGGYHGGGFHGGGYSYRPRVSIGFGFGSPFYSPFGLYGAGYGYNPYWGFPYGMYGPNYGYARMQASKLQRKVQDIKSDYEDRIYSAKHDNSLTKKERRQAVRGLKQDRDREIHETIANYHRQPLYRGQNQNQQNQNQQSQPPSDRNQLAPNQQDQHQQSQPQSNQPDSSSNQNQ